MIYFNIMPDKDEKPRKKIVVEEVGGLIDPDSIGVEVPPETQPHVEPGIHEVTKEENTPTPIIPAPKTGISPFWIIIPGIFLLGALLGGIVYYQRNISGIKISVTTPTPTPIESGQAPTPTATPTADVTKYEIKILNGSGISGEAGKAKSLLGKAGFTVSSTGNASNYSYTKSVIQAKSVVEKEFISKVTEALSKSYTVDSKTGVLPPSSGDDVIVIIGKSKS